MTERFYTADELAGMEKVKLEAVADARNLAVKGAGADGNVIAKDLVAAISAHQDRSGINPALVAVPEDQPEKTYRVTAPTAWEDHPPGSEFTATIPADREAMLLEGGALKIVNKSAEKKAASSTTKEGV